MRERTCGGKKGGETAVGGGDGANPVLASGGEEKREKTLLNKSGPIRNNRECNHQVKAKGLKRAQRKTRHKSPWV